MTTLLQRYGPGKFRQVPADRTITASGDQECFKVSDDDLELGMVCCGCEHVFEPRDFYAERPIGAQGDFEIVEVICLTCAATDASDVPEAPTSYGQDRDLPDPEGWVRATIPVVVVEGFPTGDHRLIPAGALQGHRALPIPLMSLSSTGPGGHEGATLLGRIDHLERIPGPDVTNVDTGEPFPEGMFVWRSDEVYVNPEHPDYPWIRNGALNGISVDLSETEADFEYDEETDEETMVLRAGRIAASTTCTIPAFPGAHLVLDADAPEVAAPEGEPPAMAAAGWRMETESLCAACSAPPREWFTDPDLDGPAPLTVTEDGRVFGHVTDWTTCHIGLPGCVKAPRSRSGYAYFHTGALLTDDGQMVPVGRITLGTGHADLGMGAAAATEHYDHTGACVADVAAGEDAHGIWVAGAVRPGVTDEQLRALRASPLSGDWRPIGGSLEMVGALCVNVAGFPIPRARARIAAGVPTSLVAAGAIPPKKGTPVTAPTDAPAPDATGPQDGDVVEIDGTGIRGVVTGTTPDGVELSVVCDPSMLTPVDAPPQEDPVVAGAALGRAVGMLRTMRAEHLLARIRG